MLTSSTYILLHITKPVTMTTNFYIIHSSNYEFALFH